MVWLAHQLAPLLRPRYVASVEERVFLEETGQQRIPDVWVQQVQNCGGHVAAAGLEVAAPVVVEVEEVEVREHYIEVLDRYRDPKVVTVIEVVSPSNKAPGPGRDAYLAKQREVLGAECHLVEIDLLRRGQHVVSVPHRQTRAVSPYDYLICVNRWPNRKRFELVGRRLRALAPHRPAAGAPRSRRAVGPTDRPRSGLRRRQLYAAPALRRPVRTAVERRRPAMGQRRWAAYRAAHPNGSRRPKAPIGPKRRRGIEPRPSPALHWRLRGPIGRVTSCGFWSPAAPQEEWSEVDHPPLFVPPT